MVENESATVIEEPEKKRFLVELVPKDILFI